jgi:Glycosyltransferase family 87
VASFWSEWKYPAWAGIWVLTRLLMVAQVGFWNDVGGRDFQDVGTYETWSGMLADGSMPPGDAWQYPPGASFLFLIPRIGGDYGVAFVVLMLALDLAGLALTMRLGRREGRELGVWAWLLALPMLEVLPLLRFDLVPTVIAMAMLLVVHLRPLWFGALAGLGAAIKVWPLFLLLCEWDRRLLLRAAAIALAAIALVFVLAQFCFGDAFGFVEHQNGRGLQKESVAATPWQLDEVITGTPVPEVTRFGSHEVDSALADAISEALTVAAVLALLAAALWWLARDRAIRAGAEQLRDLALARDFAFTVVLLFVVTSRVLSPQFMIWMVGLAAVVLSSTRTRLLRPALVVVAAAILSGGISSDAADLVVRNVALLVALVDAAVTLTLAVLSASSGRSQPAESR